MQLQQFNPKMVSITQVRRDIDVLEETLGKNNEALVMRNQDLLFAALSPKSYQEYQELKKHTQVDSIAKAVDSINAIREKYGKGRGKNAGSRYIIKMRDEAREKWIK